MPLVKTKLGILSKLHATVSTADRPIGIFDSGIGGLTVLAAIQQALPRERLFYFGDNAHIPYGDRSLARGASLQRRHCAGLAGQRLQADRDRLQHGIRGGPARRPARSLSAYPFVGMEPAVKPPRNITSRSWWV